MNDLPAELQARGAQREPSFGELPLCPCVYFLTMFGAVQYVGKAKNLSQRILSHRRTKRIPFDRVFFVPVEAGRLDAEERSWIKALNPPFNRAEVKAHVLARRGQVFTKKRSKRKIKRPIK